MSTTEVTAISGNTDHILVEEALLDRIQPSKANPRRRKDEKALAELADFVPGNKTGLVPFTLTPVQLLDGYQYLERREAGPSVAGDHAVERLGLTGEFRLAFWWTWHPLLLAMNAAFCRRSGTPRALAVEPAA